MPPQAKPGVSLTLSEGEHPRLDLVSSPNSLPSRAESQVKLSITLDELKAENWDRDILEGIPRIRPKFAYDMEIKSELGSVAISRDTISIDLTKIPMKLYYDDKEGMVRLFAEGGSRAEGLLQVEAAYNTVEDELKKFKASLGNQDMRAGVDIEPGKESAFLKYEDPLKRFRYGLNFRHLDAGDDVFAMDFERHNGNFKFLISPDGNYWRLDGAFKLNETFDGHFRLTELERACGVAYSSKKNFLDFGLEVEQGTHGSDVDFLGFLRLDIRR